MATADTEATRAAIHSIEPLLRAAAGTSWEHALTMEEFAEPQCFTTTALRRSVKALLKRK